ncbi:MAG: hypothetical protein HY043_03040 [Verrucomicrobia bacterium]|nr:hypothetical protein [Verrucomicrobiota bacterium]
MEGCGPMSLATIIFSGRDWLLPAAGLLVAALVILFFAYRSGGAGRAIHSLCIALKILGLIALLICLLEPRWLRQRARPGANFFAVVADNSQGLQIKDRGEPKSRGEQLRETLTLDKAGWFARLNDDFQVRRYAFDSRLQATRDFSELQFDGRSTALGGALRSLAERFQNQPIAGVLLFTDGNATDLPDGSLDVKGLPPVYPIVIGRDDAIKDVAVQKVAVTQSAFEDAPVSVQADVQTAGYAGEKIVAQLLEVAANSAVSEVEAKSGDLKKKSSKPEAKLSTKPGAASAISENKVVIEQTLTAPRNGDPLSFHLQFRPEHSGVSFYRLRVSAQAELEQFKKPELSTEATLANNQRVLVVDRGRGPYRVLYVAGRPNWEYKFLHRAVEEDDQIELPAIIRIAKREPKFEFRGRVGESSNPLFRGFGNQSKEEIERYDQPVLKRLNTQDDLELRGGFPKTAEELYAYHAIILDDLEAEFFTHEQMTLVQKFVSERGGGFLMLGGAESLHEGKYERTPIGDMLPVYVDRVPEAKPPELVRLSLTREGWLQPWARLRNNESDEKTRIDEMPPFLVMNAVRELKPGASVIANVADRDGKNFPALAVQRFGRGRSAAMMIGDLWHWGLHDAESHRDMDKAWRQMVRWLVADVPRRIEMQVEPTPGDANQAMRLQVRVRDKTFQPLDNAAVSLSVRILGLAEGVATNRVAGAASAIRLNADASPSEPGLYEATFIPRETGGYHVEATVTNSVGAELGSAEAGWSSDPAAEEFRSLRPNRALLESLAKKTGGEVIALNRLAEFTQSLPKRSAPITESWSEPIWHRADVFLFALGCFICEWGLRRWKGMA